MLIFSAFRHSHSVVIAVPAIGWKDSFLCTPTDTSEASMLAEIGRRYPGMNRWGVLGTDWTYEVRAFAR
jgi:hypothetical protein